MTAMGSIADTTLIQAAPAITGALCWLLLMVLCGVWGQCSLGLLHLLGKGQRGRLPSLWLLEVYPFVRLDILSCGLTKYSCGTSLCVWCWVLALGLVRGAAILGFLSHGYDS